MSNESPPLPPSSPSPAANPSLWGRYRALPVWLQVLIPVVIIAIVIGIWAIATNDSDDSTSSADTTVAGSSMDNVLTRIIIAGGIRVESTTTTTTEVAEQTTVPATEPTELTTTLAPATTVAATSAPAPATTAGAGIPATTTPPATAAPTTKPPATAAPATTAAPTTPAPTTEVPTTEPEPTTTTEEEPPTTDGSTAPLPSPADFLAQWNAAAEGTDVPPLSRDQITKIVDGPFAGAFLATLAPNEDGDIPQVGLIGTLSATDPTQLAELLLVYVSGPDESASDFYWECFGVLAQAVDPAMTDAQIAVLEKSLGRAEGMPPFPPGTNNTADNNGFNYNLYTGATQEGTPATGIAVS